MNELTKRQRNDLKILVHFIEISCRSRHRGRQIQLSADLAWTARKQLFFCADCAKLMNYAVTRLRSCPLDPKPLCKKCQVHCYRPEYRARIREIMAWSGRRMILRGRLDLITHYFF